MKFCTKCGKEIMDEAVICPSCGCSQSNTAVQSTEDSSSFGYAVLGFCVPIVGLILYLMWKNTTPRRAKSAGTGALVSFIIGIVVWIIYAVIMGAVIGSSVSYF